MNPPDDRLTDPGSTAAAESRFREGLVLGVLIGEGHFGGDGKQPQVTLRMHTRHAALFRWIDREFPGGRVYGPYHHGGRDYMQWMARGEFLREVLVPLLEQHLTPELDAYAYERYAGMRERYARALGRSAARPEPPNFSTPTT